MDAIKNKIIHGNTLDVLRETPSDIFDCGVTSPPYNKQEKNNGWLVKNVVYDKFKDVMSEEDYQQNQIDVLNELYRTTKAGGHFFYNHKIRWDKGKLSHPMEWVSKTKWAIRQEIIWDRAIAANIRGWRFWQVEERIYWLCKPVNGNLIGEELKSHHALMTSIWRFSPEQKSEHPAPFPIALPTRCIYSVLNDRKDCLVIDPYAGSGTTLVASKMLGHNFCGIDISEDYISLAEQRIKHLTQKDKRFFDEEIAKHKVTKTFKERKDEGLYAKRKQPEQSCVDLFSQIAI
jgi:modification methylase